MPELIPIMPAWELPPEHGLAITPDLNAFKELKGLPPEHKTIAVDVDGILFPFTRAFSSKLPGEGFEEADCPAWKTYPREFTAEAIKEACLYAHSREAILRFGLYPGALEAFKLFRDFGISTVIMTRREEERVAETEVALQELGLSFDDYLAAPDLNKVEECLSRGISVLLDDKPSTLEAASQAGLIPLSLKYPYNQHLADRVRLVRGWAELQYAVLAALLYQAKNLGI